MRKAESWASSISALRLPKPENSPNVADETRTLIDEAKRGWV